MTNDSSTAPFPPEQQNPPKKCKFTPLLDGIRIFVLSLFTCAYSLIATFCFSQPSLTLTNYLLSLNIQNSGLFTICYFLCGAIIILLLALPYLTVAFFLVKSFRHMFKFLWLQLIVYGAYIGLIGYILFTTASSGLMLLLIILAIVFGVTLIVQVIALLARTVICAAIKNRKIERILGWCLVGASILSILIIILLLL